MPRRLRRAGITASLALSFSALMGLSATSHAQDPVLFYPGEYYGGSTTPDGATPIILQPGQVSPDLQFSLSQSGGEIRGVLRATVEGTERPLAKVWVEAVVGKMRVGVFTAVNGSFHLSKIPAGRVRVRYSTDAWGSPFPELRAIWQGGSADSVFALQLPLTNGRVIDLSQVRMHEGSLLSGEVLGDEKTPLARVKVRVILQSIANPRSWTAVTDRNGRWVQGGLSDGLYKVLALTDGSTYISEYLGGSRESIGATVVNLLAQQQLTGLILSPDSGATIGGLLLLTGGEPAAGLEVEAIHSTTRRVYRATANELGIYQIIGLPTGTYYVHVPAMYKYYPNSPTEHDAGLVRVTEPSSNLGIDITGNTTEPCLLSNGSAGAISGTITATFDQMPLATVVAYSETDSLRREVTGPGGYSIPCVPGGFYRVVFRPEGPFRTQYHPMARFENDATVIHVLPPDSVMRVDFKPERAVVLAGSVVDEESQFPVAGIRIWAREDTSGVVVEGRTDGSGSFRFERLEDGSGLPAGRWIVRAESTLISFEQPTPVMQPSLSAAARAGAVEIEWTLAPGIDWSLALDRVEEAREVRVLTQERVAGGDGAFVDHPPAGGQYLYRLSATPVDASEPSTYTAESGPIELVLAARLIVRPNPARGPIEFAWEGGPSPLTHDARLRVFTLDGREVASIGWPANATALSWDPGRGRTIASGRYFYRLESADGPGRAYEGTLVVQR